MSSTAYPPYFAYPAQQGAVADQVVIADSALHHPGVLVAGVLDRHRIALFAILLTTRYPKGLFDFNVGVFGGRGL